MQESIVFLVRVQGRCKESSRSLSHLLMSFLLKACRTVGLSAEKYKAPVCVKHCVNLASYLSVLTARVHGRLSTLPVNTGPQHG